MAGANATTLPYHHTTTLPPPYPAPGPRILNHISSDCRLAGVWRGGGNHVRVTPEIRCCTHVATLYGSCGTPRTVKYH